MAQELNNAPTGDGPAPARLAPTTGTGTAASGSASPAQLRTAHRWLLATCVTFALLTAVLVPLQLPLGWDEIVYATRFDRYRPPVPFTAPRTRGVPLLLAPIASWSGSTAVLRLWMLTLSAAALYLGFRPWLRVLRRPAAAPVAAALYGSLWVALFYANSAMPNHYTATGAAAAVGCFLLRSPGGAAVAGVAAGVATATLMRPLDGATVAAALLLAAALLPTWRTPGRLLGVLGGVTAGALPWLIEAELSFGGVLHRMAAASDEQGHMRPLFAVPFQLTALDGPLLCRPCVHDTVQPTAASWWLVLPLLTAVGLWSVHRSAGRRGPMWLTVAVAAAVAGPYLFLVPYAAPRFLFPGYALLVIPAAVGLLAVAGRARRSVGRTTALAAALLGHLAVQVTLVHTHSDIQQRAREDWQRISAVLGESGVHAPCLLDGNRATVPLAYTAGCTAAEGDQRSGPPDALVLRDKQPPHWAEDWPRHRVPDTYNPGWTVAVRPG